MQPLPCAQKYSYAPKAPVGCLPALPVACVQLAPWEVILPVFTWAWVGLCVVIGVKINLP